MWGSSSGCCNESGVSGSLCDSPSVRSGVSGFSIGDPCEDPCNMDIRSSGGDSGVEGGGGYPQAYGL